MIYEKTADGVQAFQQKSTQLSAKLRSILIMIDGKRSSADLLGILAGIGANQEQLAELLKLGFIREKAGGVNAQPPGKSASVGSGPAGAAPGNTVSPADQQAASVVGTEQQRYQAAYLIATRLTSGLGLRGFRLNLSVEGAGSLQDLLQLAGKIREAVGDEKYAELKRVLGQ
jgi:hypothetical protein